jgi:hypothetical protein
MKNFSDKHLTPFKTRTLHLITARAKNFSTCNSLELRVSNVSGMKEYLECCTTGKS